MRNPSWKYKRTCSKCNKKRLTYHNYCLNCKRTYNREYQRANNCGKIRRMKDKIEKRTLREMSMERLKKGVANV